MGAFSMDSRVGFLAKNGDSKETSANAERYPLFCCGDSALITTQGKSLESPCKAPFLAQKSCREQLEVESTFEKSAENKKTTDIQSVASLEKVDSSDTAQNAKMDSRQSEITPSGDAPHIDLAREKRLWDLLLERG